MAGKSAFDQKTIKTLAVSDKRDLLEELNLPPQFVSFVKKNLKEIKIGAIVLVVALFGWQGYVHYASVQQEKSTALLAQAVKENSVDARRQKLENVLSGYSRTDAGLWARIELAHASFDAGKYDEAIEKYQAVLDKLDSESALAPLVLYNLAQAFENKEDFDNALVRYGKLAEFSSFSSEAHLAEGRIHDKRNEPDKALAAYEQLNALDSSSTDEKGWIADKLAKLRLKVSSSGSGEK